MTLICQYPDRLDISVFIDKAADNGEWRAEARVYGAVGRLCFARLPAAQGDAVPSVRVIPVLRGIYCIVSVDVPSAAPRRGCTGRSAGFALLACLLLKGDAVPSMRGIAALRGDLLYSIGRCYVGCAEAKVYGGGRQALLRSPACFSGGRRPPRVTPCRGESLTPDPRGFRFAVFLFIVSLI